AILNTGRVDLHFQKHAQGVDQNMPLAALDLLACIVADIAAGIRTGLHRLAIDDGKRWLFLATLRVRRPALERVRNAWPRPARARPFDRMLGRALRWEIVWQRRPLAARLEEVEDGVHHRPQ